MARFIVAACAMLGLSELAPARAQFGFGPPFGHAYGHSHSYSYRGGFGFAVGGPRFYASGFSGGFVSRSAFYAPFGPVVPFGFGNPAFFGPAFGPGFGFGPPVVVVQPIVLGGNFGPPDALAGNPLPRNDPVALPRGAKETDFFVIAPKKATVPEITRVAPIPLPLPVPAVDPFKPAVKVAAEMPDPDPKKEAVRLVKLARAAFVAEDYGRAAEHFDRATKSDPGDARTYFLHAQARFAAGQYADAVARIRAGLDLDPKWPAAAFDPAELYAARPDRYATHLAALKKAVADSPGQATLEFLLGYQSWFGGEKAEAEKLFRAAEARLAAPGPIALFK